MHSQSILLGLAALIAASQARASDLFVNPNRPGAFATLQAAHDAAQPGDRILVEVDLPATGETVIRKSLTIESIDDNRRTLPYVGDANQPGRFLIDGLTPGLPLTLRSLSLVFLRQPGSQRATVGIRCNPNLHGKLMMDHMSVDNGPVDPDLATTLMDFDSQLSELWVRNTRFIARDTAPGDGCAGQIADKDGSDAFRCNCRVLVLEDSECFAGSAAFLRYTNCGNQAPFGGVGGRAAYAQVDATVVVNCLFSDGNGGDVEIGPWAVTPIPGLRNPSIYTSFASVFEAFTSGHEPARDGVLAAAPDRHRQGYQQFGNLNTRLHMGGDCRVGGTADLTATLQPNEAVVALLSIGWNFYVLPAPLGILWIDMPSLLRVVPFGVTATASLQIPADTALLQLPLVTQGVLVPQVELTNPSGIQVRL